MQIDQANEVATSKNDLQRRSKGGKFTKTITAEKRATTLMLRCEVLKRVQALTLNSGLSISEQIDSILGHAVGVAGETPPAAIKVQPATDRASLKYATKPLRAR